MNLTKEHVLTTGDVMTTAVISRQDLKKFKDIVDTNLLYFTVIKDTLSGAKAANDLLNELKNLRIDLTNMIEANKVVFKE